MPETGMNPEFDEKTNDEILPEYEKSIDQPLPIFWRINGAEVRGKMLMAGKR